MIESKRFGVIASVLVVIAMVFLLAAAICRHTPTDITASDSDYAETIFAKDVINIDIEIDENDWDSMIENKANKPYFPCTLTIDGESYDEVGIRPKGNSSLTSVNTERLSFRFNTDYYIDGQNCHGLHKFVINNVQADATYMKDKIAYDLMNYMGVEAPLHTFANVTKNGEPFGFYLAVEVYDEDYSERVFPDTDTILYNVKSSDMDTFEAAIVDSESGEAVSSYVTEEETFDNAAPGNGMSIPGNPGGAPGGQSGGNLQYVGDSTDDYRAIFANAVSDDTTVDDNARVVRAIKVLNTEGVTLDELDEYWNADEILRYLAVHTFMANFDSYISNMQQNYYIAEQSGRISILPWDYNLSFGGYGDGGGAPAEGMQPPDGNGNAGGMQPPNGNGNAGGVQPPNGNGNAGGMQPPNGNGNAGGMQPPNGNGNAGGMQPPTFENSGSNGDSTLTAINFPIDTPVSGVEMSERPLVSVLLGIDECKEKYHEYLRSLIDYVSGDYISVVEEAENIAYPYIENDATAFYTVDEHLAAVETLYEYLHLRCESIRGQLGGTVPSTTEGQSENSDLLINGDISVDTMGGQGNGGNGMALGGAPNLEQGNAPGENPEMSGGNQPSVGMPGNGGMPNQDSASSRNVALVVSTFVLAVGIAAALLFKKNC